MYWIFTLAIIMEIIFTIQNVQLKWRSSPDSNATSSKTTRVNLPREYWKTGFLERATFGSVSHQTTFILHNSLDGTLLNYTAKRISGCNFEAIKVTSSVSSLHQGNKILASIQEDQNTFTSVLWTANLKGTTVLIEPAYSIPIFQGSVKMIQDSPPTSQTTASTFIGADFRAVQSSPVQVEYTVPSPTVDSTRNILMENPFRDFYSRDTDFYQDDPPPPQTLTEETTSTTTTETTTTQLLPEHHPHHRKPGHGNHLPRNRHHHKPGGADLGSGPGHKKHHLPGYGNNEMSRRDYEPDELSFSRNFENQNYNHHYNRGRRQADIPQGNSEVDFSPLVSCSVSETQLKWTKVWGIVAAFPHKVKGLHRYQIKDFHGRCLRSGGQLSLCSPSALNALWDVFKVNLTQSDFTKMF